MTVVLTKATACPIAAMNMIMTNFRQLRGGGWVEHEHEHECECECERERASCGDGDRSDIGKALLLSFLSFSDNLIIKILYLR